MLHRSLVLLYELGSLDFSVAIGLCSSMKRRNASAESPTVRLEHTDDYHFVLHVW